MKRVNLSILISTILVGNLGASGLDYLNSLRTKAGLVPFKAESHLQKAAKNHSQYLQLNNTYGHYENRNGKGFTGVTPSDRVIYANYPTRMVIENVSTGDYKIQKSIDSLFAAIYHRFGFLDIAQDEIGIGISDVGRHYTYEMGNRAVAKLCQGNHYSGGSYVYRVCANTSKRIDVSLYQKAVNAHKDQAPDLIIWPPKNSSDIPPAFFIEDPDPLPNESVSGYPVSVQFNDLKFDRGPKVSDFSIQDDSGDTLTLVASLNQKTDPNHRFSEYQHAIFTKQRLDWGSRYYVNLSYSYDGGSYDEDWCFSTRSLKEYAQKVYRVEDDPEATLNVVSGVTYAIYVVPKDGNDIFQSYRYSYSSSVEADINFIDYNTLSVNVQGRVGGWVKISLANGQKLTLRVANRDSASTPKDEKCEGAEPQTSNRDTSSKNSKQESSDRSRREQKDNTQNNKNLNQQNNKKDSKNIKYTEPIDIDMNIDLRPNSTQRGNKNDSKADKKSSRKDAKSRRGRRDIKRESNTEDKRVKKPTKTETSPKEPETKEQNRKNPFDRFIKKPNSTEDLNKNRAKPELKDDFKDNQSKIKTPKKATIVDDKGAQKESIKSKLDSGLTLEANRLNDSSLECKIGNEFYEKTYIKVNDIFGALLKLDDNKNVTIDPAIDDLDLKIFTDTEGRVKILSESIIKPKDELPFGTTVNLDKDKLEVVIPLEDKLEF